MYFLFQQPIADAIQEKFNININNDEYNKTIFSVDSIEIEDPVILPFDKTYKGYILIFKNDKPIYALLYTLKSHENIPEQSICYISIDESAQHSIELDSD